MARHYEGRGAHMDTEYDTSWSDPAKEERYENLPSLRWMSSYDRERLGASQRSERREYRVAASDYEAFGGSQQTFGGMAGGYTGALFRRAGSYAGRGPKHWQRSEQRIREDVSEALTQHPDVDASEIEVQSAAGEVTLSGSVSTLYEKRVAEDCAWNVAGVRDVHNRIRVLTPVAARRHPE